MTGTGVCQRQHSVTCDKRYILHKSFQYINLCGLCDLGGEKCRLIAEKYVAQDHQKSVAAESAATLENLCRYQPQMPDISPLLLQLQY